jgi:hypothetical protein
MGVEPFLATPEEGTLDSSDLEKNPVGGVDGVGTSLVPVNHAGPVTDPRVVVREVGVLLIVSGIAGILLPGPVGTPLLILGCVMIWPKAFERIDLCLARRFPRAHHLGVLQSTRFLSDLERRYPVSR